MRVRERARACPCACGHVAQRACTCVCEREYVFALRVRVYVRVLWVVSVRACDREKLCACEGCLCDVHACTRARERACKSVGWVWVCGCVVVWVSG